MQKRRMRMAFAVAKGMVLQAKERIVLTICNAQIRSRAVSLQRYTCSSDDKLKHATKLLKAELPVSIRLIGLRMSQFNEEIRNSDPSQVLLSSSFKKIHQGNIWMIMTHLT